MLETFVHPTARVGTGARISPGVRIGPEADVRPNAVVTDDVPALAVVDGDPARVVSYAHEPRHSPSDWLRRLPQVNQARGSLTYMEVGADLPFTVRRTMIVKDVPPGGHRGNHGHLTLQELLVCVAGSCDVLLDDGLGRREVLHLDGAGTAAYVGPMVWTAQFGHSPDAVLLVLASAEYEPDDYVDDYDEFVTHARAANAR